MRYALCFMQTDCLTSLRLNDVRYAETSIHFKNTRFVRKMTARTLYILIISNRRGKCYQPSYKKLLMLNYLLLIKVFRYQNIVVLRDENINNK
jgi:hypothetical protein